MTVLRFLVLAMILGLVTVPVGASDMDFGSTARSMSMGGAGIALGDDSGTTAVLNPAAPAVSGARMKFVFPGLEFHSEGATFGDVVDSISKLSDGSSDSAIDLVNDFGKKPTTLSVKMVTGFAGTFGIMGQGEARGVISPGAAASEWAVASQNFNSGNFTLSSINGIQNANFQATIANAKLYLADDSEGADLSATRASFGNYLNDLSENHVTATVAYGPSVMLSRGFKTGSGELFVGTNINLLYAKTKKWQVTATADAENPLNATGTASSPNITAGVIFDAVEQPLSDTTTIKADLGAVYKPNESMFQYGLVINNFVKPKLSDISNTSEDAIFSVGIAAKPVYGLTLVADLINLTKANSTGSQLRMGAEWKFGHLLAARAGYTGSNFSYGFEVLGLNVAFSKRMPALLSNVLKF